MKKIFVSHAKILSVGLVLSVLGFSAFLLFDPTINNKTDQKKEYKTDVTVTVYLKSGMDVSLDISDTTISDQQRIYRKAFNKKFINHVGIESDDIVMIPVKEVALIQFKENK